MTAARIAELTVWIASISSKKDCTPPAERHHLREVILPMQRQILRLSGFTGSEGEVEAEARRRTIEAVPVISADQDFNRLRDLDGISREDQVRRTRAAWRKDKP